MSVTSDLHSASLSLVRLGIGHKVSEMPRVVDWREMEALAGRQGLSAIVMDGVERLPEELRPPKEVLVRWIGSVVKLYEQRYELYRRCIAEMAGFYNSHGLRMMVLKGYGCSLNWPRPEHRPSGDIDIWQFGRYKEADDLLMRVKGIEVDNSHHHHTVFYWRGFMVENHYDFVNVHGYRSSRDLEVIFKELGKDDNHFVELFGERVYLPSANLHALFLVRHLASHFAAIGVNLRQVLDWAFFVEKQGSAVDWKWLVGVLERFGMMEFFNCVNAICLEDLGFERELFLGCGVDAGVMVDRALKERMLQDIVEPEFGVSESKGLLLRLLYKFKRWRGNGWKQRLCYKESRFVSFFKGLWAHFLKPSSF